MRILYIKIFFILFSMNFFSQTIVSVKPTKEKTNTNIYIKKGDNITIEVVDGKWTLWKDYYPEVDGFGHSFDPLNGLGKWGALLGQIGTNPPFLINNFINFESKDEGILYLFPNKDKYLIQNSYGELQVKITNGIEKGELINNLISSGFIQITIDNNSLISSHNNIYCDDYATLDIYAFGEWSMLKDKLSLTNVNGYDFKKLENNYNFGSLMVGVGTYSGILFDEYNIGSERKSLDIKKGGFLYFYPNIENYKTDKQGVIDIFIKGAKIIENNEITIYENNIIRYLEQIYLNKINNFRRICGLSELEINPILSKEAIEHTKYMVVNDSFSLDEEMGKQFYVGKTFEDRLKQYGYYGKVTSLFCQLDYREQNIFEIFINTVYHRLKLMDPELKYFGFGCYNKNNRSIYNLTLGYEDEKNKKRGWDYITYPNEKSTNISNVWNGYDVPDPLPDVTKKRLDIDNKEVFLLGYPISILLERNYEKIVSYEIINNKNEIIKSYILSKDNDPNKKLINSIVLIPEEPLNNNSYTIKISIDYGNNQIINYQWSFIKD